MRDETSIARQLRREECFVPPYCPRPKCQNHRKENARPDFWRRHGVKELKRFPYFSYRFLCRDCGVTFSGSIFSLHYRQKVWGLNYAIFRYHDLGVSRRATARELGHSERLVRTRIRNMARWALLKQAELIEKLKIEEAIVYDGLENFSFSQFDPNNINHAVGKRSLFIYDFNFAPLNRKGRMSPSQAKRKAELEAEHGPYPRDAIRSSTKRVFQRLLSKGPSLVLYTDKHFQYQRVVEQDLRGAKIDHIRISSKVHRNFRNPLFAVNNIDLQARHNLSAFKRETIAFSKHSIAMQDSFLLYAISRNFLRPKFWGTHRSDPECSKKSPAMELGLTEKILKFNEFFSERVLPSQVQLNEDWKNLYDRVDPHSRREIALAPAI